MFKSKSILKKSIKEITNVIMLLLFLFARKNPSKCMLNKATLYHDEAELRLKINYFSR